MMLSGVVLAGGMGSRMGCDKGLVELAGRPMLLRVVGALSSAAADVTVAVSKGRGQAYRELLGPDVGVVEDRVPGKGPLEGLSNALREVGHEYVAVVPCDVPLLRADVLELLGRAAAGKDGAVPVVGGFVEPLVAVYERDVGLERFSGELETGVGKVGNALARMDIRRVGEEDLRKVDARLLSFWNINSKEDLERAEEELRLRGTPAPHSSATS